MREPEPATIAEAAAGDRAAFVALVHLYQDPVWRFLTRLVGDPGLAEDLTQETFVKVHGALGSFGGRSRFSTWVFGIARNTGIDAMRKRDRRPQIVGPPSADLAQVGALGHATEIQAAIASLSTDHREALLLIEVLGLTYREVASLTDTAEGTIKSRVHHARRQLHLWLYPEVAANEL